MNTENVHYQQENRIAWIRITRPKVLNALNKQTLKDLLEVVCFTQKQILKGEIHLVVLTGALSENPKLHSFIAGADIKELHGLSSNEAYEIAHLGQQLSNSIESLKCCVVAAVGGYALGGGLEMALSCDFIWSTQNAQFGLPEVKLGLIPGFGGTQRLTKSIGRYAAREMIYSGMIIKTPRAQELGLVQRVFENYEQLEQGIKKFSLELEECSTNAISHAKAVIHQTADKELSQGLYYELNAFSRIFSTHDALEGTKAFLEKRAPVFDKEIL